MRTGATLQLKSPQIIEFRNHLLKLRFFKDDRIHLVKQVLSSPEEPILSIKITSTMSVEEISAAQQTALGSWTQNHFPLNVGLGMLNFESAVIIPTEIYRIPKLKCSARLPPMNALIELSVPASSDVLDWPDFHGGVAAALEIRSDCLDVDSSWIVFNQSTKDGKAILDAKHGGFIFGLGLTKHLRKLESADSLRNYFLPQFQVLSIGHLLGLAVAYIGQRSEVVLSMLSVHIPSLLPNNAMELSNSQLLKSGAIVGYGLVNLCTPTQYALSRAFAELKTIKHEELNKDNDYGNLYAVSCGFSIVGKS